MAGSKRRLCPDTCIAVARYRALVTAQRRPAQLLPPQAFCLSPFTMPWSSWVFGKRARACCHCSPSLLSVTWLPFTGSFSSCTLILSLVVGVAFQSCTPPQIASTCTFPQTSSGSLGLSAREGRCPCAWRGGACHCSRVMVGESVLKTPSPLRGTLGSSLRSPADNIFL